MTAGTDGRSALAAHRAGDRAWWETEISEVSDGRIIVRGRPIEELIGSSTFVQHLVFLFAGRQLSPAAAGLLEAAMVAAADHGPRAPSIAAARMAATCGVTFNAAVATGINLLGETHGGAATNAMHTLLAIDEAAGDGGAAGSLDDAATAHVRDARSRRQPVPGYGHQLHTIDPRRAPMLELLHAAVEAEAIGGRYVEVGLVLEAALEREVGRPVTLNIDGLWAMVCCELELPPDFAMGAFCLSRGAGIVAHVHEEGQSGVRIKGPCPPGDDLVRYVGIQPT